jgi:hypothetical protein
MEMGMNRHRLAASAVKVIAEPDRRRLLWVAASGFGLIAALPFSPESEAKKKKKKRKKCRCPTSTSTLPASSFGCTVKQAERLNSCQGVNYPCFDTPNTVVTYCLVSSNGATPVCALNFSCASCDSDDDCSAGTVCVKCSGVCAAQGGTACATPYAPS